MSKGEIFARLNGQPLTEESEKIIIANGEKIGKVSGGGAARGCATTGVNQELKKAEKEGKFTFDMTIGASVGELNEVAYLADVLDQLAAVWKKMKMTDVFNLNLHSLKHGGLVSNGPLEKMIREIIGPEEIAKVLNSPTKLFIVSSDLRGRSEYIIDSFRDGEHLFGNMLGSSAMPGIETRIESDFLAEMGYRIKILGDGALAGSNYPIIEAIEIGRCKTFVGIPLHSPNIRVEDGVWCHNDPLHTMLRAVDTLFVNQYAKDMRTVIERIETANALEKIISSDSWKKYGAVGKREIEELYDKYRYYEGVRIIEPEFETLTADLPDFIAKKTGPGVDIGRRAGKKMLQMIKFQ